MQLSFVVLSTSLFAVCLLQHAALGAAIDDATAEEAVVPATPVLARSVPLQKQYVPVVRGGKTIAYKTAYFGEVAVGSAGSRQPFTVVFDTGSGHFILPSTACKSETCLKHRRYNRTLSQNAIDIDTDGSPIRADAKERDNVAIGFGTGEVLGEFVREEVCAGNDAGATVTSCVTLHAVVAKQMTEDPFGLFAFDGVLGLGLDALALNPHFSFFGQMVGQHPAMQPYFAVFLSRTDGGESTITFGGHDDKLAASEFEWAPVALKELGYWTVQIKTVRIGETVLEDCADGSCRAILDTGTSMLGVPRATARGLHKLLARPVAEGVEAKDVDCRSVPGHAITFDLVDGPSITLKEEDYSRPTPFNITTGSGQSRLFCRSLLLPVDMQAPLGPRVFIWGEPMLRRYYTMYDFAQKRVGFAVAGIGAEASGPSTIGAPTEGSRLSGAPLAPQQAASPDSKQDKAGNTAILE